MVCGRLGGDKTEKPPPTETALMVSGAVPVFVTVRVLSAIVPGQTSPKSIKPGESEAFGMPTSPLADTVYVVWAGSSVSTTTLAVSGPVDVADELGANFTCTVRLSPARIVAVVGGT